VDVFVLKQPGQRPESRLQMHALIIRLLALLRACVRFRNFLFPQKAQVPIQTEDVFKHHFASASLFFSSELN